MLYSTIMFKPRIKGYYKDFKNPTFDGIFEPEDYVIAKINEALRNSQNTKNIYFK